LKSPKLKCGHTTLNNNCRDCKSLKNFWDDKLETSGVENIEQEDGNLKTWSSLPFYDPSGNKTEFFRAKEEYYRLAAQFLYEHNFTSRRDELIWKYHSEGISRRKIRGLLKTKGYKAISFQRIDQIIQAILKEMTTKLK